MNRKSDRADWRYTGLVVTLVAWPVLVEVVRKYVWYSDIVYVAGGAVVLLAAFASLPRLGARHRELAPLYLLAWAYLLIGGSSNFVADGASLGAFLVGVHALVLPLAYFLAVSGVASQLDDPVMVGAKAVTVLSVVVGGIALAQVILGPGHPINRLPGELGTGTYTWSGVRGIEGVFRPASVFLHTGKFGLGIFVLALFKLIVFFSRTGLPDWYLPSLGVDVMGVVLSGQRSAWLLLVALLSLVAVSSAVRRKLRMMLLVGGLGALGWGVSVVGGEWFLNAAGQRATTLLPAAAGRLESTLLRPWGPVFDHSGILGDGLGMYTSGSSAFGGRPLYSVVTSGLPEGTWHRVLAETGPLGLAIFVLLFAYLIFVLFRWSRRRDERQGPALVFLATGLILLGVWGLVHDVFANVTGMTLLLALGGLGVARPARPADT